MLSTSDFGAFHAGVHGGNRPFAWQQRLLEQIVAVKHWPRVLDLPTGAGKTTCIDVALFALALDATSDFAERWCPRRIAMVVDRRVVVDQVAQRGRDILRALLTSPEPVVIEVARRLRTMARAGEEPIGVFTLRGGIPKDDGWARTPDQPLVIASTVDQVGSRLLMQGYGVSQGMKPVHAGLLANDTLLLLDEVHLSEPFRQTLDQLARLRARFSGSGVKSRFAHAFLSATPGTQGETPFGLLDEETRPDSPLGPRLHASKPVRLVERDDRSALEQACVDQCMLLLERHRTIAVVVNRVTSATLIARRLAEALGADAVVTQLTGRMRPIDRDEVLRELVPAVRTGRDRTEEAPKRVVVGTQCMEAGADFDFDALVTEAASLDSLRQRFGRVDRLGRYQQSEGVIVSDKSCKDDDPVYGSAVVETVKWFKEQERERPQKLKDELTQLKGGAKALKGEARHQVEARIARRSLVDFGVLALDVPKGGELSKLLAPKQDAPTLLPAYLDLWMQTSPAPCQVPDASLWLHGSRSGPEDVQVLWRADLFEEHLRPQDAEVATAIVASIRPSSLEALSLPFATARAWLVGLPIGDFSDAEGAAADQLDDPAPSGRRALRWDGDASEVICARSDSEPCLRPGDTLVVPASYGGIRHGCFDPGSTAPVRDLAEQAQLLARARPVLRLHPAVLDGLGLALPSDEPEEARAGLGALAATENWPAWKRLWADRLVKGRTALVVPGDPSWMVIEAPRVPLAELRRAVRPEDTLEDGVESTTDADDSFHAGRSVSLARHSADVESVAREYALRCGLGPTLAQHLAMAAWLHDIGKADKRFQLLLRGGSEIEFFKDETPWAKSGMPPGARGAHRIAQRKSRYPQGARHEVQSVAMLHAQIEIIGKALESVTAMSAPDLDLVLHLVASHHGCCRPFAPPVVDECPVEVSLARHRSDTFGEIDFVAVSSCNGLHRLDSPLADRFWTLVAKYGWQELCWLEAILRLADHRASEEERAGEGSS